MAGKRESGHEKKPNIFSLVKPYKGIILLLIFFTLVGNGVNLVIPKIISHGIDSFSSGNFVLKKLVLQFFLAAFVIFIFTYLQSIVQTYSSERVARDIRSKLSAKISRQSYAFVMDQNPNKLLTNLTSDIDSLKMFVARAIVSIVSSIFLIVGTSVLLITINWRLALPVLLIIPLISITFFLVFAKVKILFKRSREVIDWLNKVINESILGSAIIRVLNSQASEYDKFLSANTEAKNIGLGILRMFAALIPLIIFIANLAVLTVLALGGHLVIKGNMTLGNFAAFNSYIALLIFPIMVIGFMSNVIAQASASYARINHVLSAPETAGKGAVSLPLKGNITLDHISVSYDGKPVLKDISFTVSAGSQVAVVGPTAAGKSQLLYLLTGLIRPEQGTITFDSTDLEAFDKASFHSQIGFVFQDSVMFNLSLRENIAFNKNVTDEALEKAIQTAELKDFTDSLPQGLDTMVAERGTSLSGGQKQRIMLARALALDPVILFLDDFTSRVDKRTEKKILCNVLNNYPRMTILSVTQSISSIKDYDQIILLMEGELVAKGTHRELMETCPEYVQISNSQRSTSYYEL